MANEQPPMLNPASAIPLHYQLAQHLKRQIDDGTLVPGQSLPSERELGERYAVSRPTVRQALQALTQDGLLERRRGVGTFVAQRRLRQPLISVMGFSERIEREGRRPSTQLIQQHVLTAARAGVGVGASLQVSPQSPVWRVGRLRLVDNEPHLLQTVHLPLERMPGLDQVDLGAGSLYRTMRDRYDIEINRVFETLEPVLPKAREAKLLGIARAQPVMRVVTTTLDQSGRPVEYTVSLARADRCQHYIEVNFGGQGHSVILRQTQLEVALSPIVPVASLLS